MPLPKPHTEERYTYADYLTWPDDERWELIDGVPYAMSPAPGVNHQRVSRRLENIFENHLKDKTCEMFHAPFDVRLLDRPGLTDEKIETVVQPDILVVCDKAKLDERGLNGAPDLIVEILSPSTAAHDLKIKFELYQRHGVTEFWVVHPNDQTVLVFRRGDDGFYGRAAMYTASDIVAVPLLGELEIDLKAVFAE